MAVLLSTLALFRYGLSAPSPLSFVPALRKSGTPRSHLPEELAGHGMVQEKRQMGEAGDRLGFFRQSQAWFRVLLSTTSYS